MISAIRARSDYLGRFAIHDRPGDTQYPAVWLLGNRAFFNDPVPRKKTINDSTTVITFTAEAFCLAARFVREMNDARNIPKRAVIRIVQQTRTLISFWLVIAW